MLWVDKYRPKTLDKMMIVHQDIALNLQKLLSFFLGFWFFPYKFFLLLLVHFSPSKGFIAVVVVDDVMVVQVSEHDCPHLLFYGPPGAGKKTLIMALLKQMFGPSAEKVKIENKIWKIDAGTRTLDLELTTLSGTHHLELNPSDAGFQDSVSSQ